MPYFICEISKLIDVHVYVLQTLINVYTIAGDSETKN